MATSGRKDEIVIKVIPDRGVLARRLCGMGAGFAPERDLVAKLDEERKREDRERIKELRR